MSRARRPRLRRGPTLVLCLALAWAVACAVSWAMPAPTPSRPTGDVLLTDDDGEAPLFPMPSLTPGDPVTRCLGLQFTSDGGGDVRLVATGVNRAAASEVAIRIDLGEGGRFGDCSGFNGTTVFQGTLAELTDRGTDWAAALPLVRPAGTGSFVVRMTASIDGSARQGLDSRASFAFTARSTVERIATEPTSVLPAASPTPTATPKADKEDVKETKPPLPEATETPTPAPAPPAAVTPEAGGTLDVPRVDGGATPVRPRRRSSGPDATPVAGGLPAGQQAGEQLAPDGKAQTGVLPPTRKRSKPLTQAVVEQLGKIGQHITKAAETVLVRSPFPLALALLVFGFLGLQNRIDRRDPKLAMAPTFGDPDVAFRDPVMPSRGLDRDPTRGAALKSSGDGTDSLV